MMMNWISFLYDLPMLLVVSLLFDTDQKDVNNSIIFISSIASDNGYYDIHENFVNDMIDNLILRIPQKINYNITKQGSSTLRNLTSTEYELLTKTRRISSTTSNSSKILAPLLILLNNDESAMDKCHEMILGVNTTNIKEAEYAATHPPSSWSKEHPLNSDLDILHAFLHRMEGNNIGEGGYTGYENAKYWIAGGSKELDTMTNHYIWKEMKRYVESCNIFDNLNLITNDVRTYDVISGGGGGGGRTRLVTVQKGLFDAFRYFQLCKSRYQNECISSSDMKNKYERDLIDQLQRKEVQIMLQYSFLGVD